MNKVNIEVTIPPDANIHSAPNLKQYLFRVLSALMASLSLLVWAPASLFLRRNLRLTAVSLMFGVVFLMFTALARKRNVYLFRLCCVALVFQANMQWYMNAGSMGKQELGFFVLPFSAILFLHGATRLVFLFAVVLDGLALYGIDMVAPGWWAIGYSSPIQRLQEHAVAFVVIMLLFAWALRFIMEAYEREHEELRRTHRELQKTLAELRVLRGFLSTCAWCNKVREDDGTWVPMEIYIQEHTHALFTHGACPECAKLLLKDGRAPTIKQMG